MIQPKETQKEYIKEMASLIHKLAQYTEFIERIESTTTDKVVANKIREFLKKEKVWE